MAVSTLSSVRIAELAPTGAEIWVQLHWLSEPDRVDRLVKGAGPAHDRA